MADPASETEDAVARWRRRAAELLAFRPQEAVALGLLLLAVVAGAAFAYARSLPRPAAPGARPLASASEARSPGARVVVHVAGAVVRPGVYELPGGARVVDGLQAAGGPAADADLAAINLARPLADGERVWVPRRGEAPQAVAAGEGSGGEAGRKVNLNTATVAELEALPGIGQVLAERIVEYRTKHGPFRSVRDLLKVEGIGERKLQSIQDHVTV
jgi:competence protein ComEA